MTDVYSQDFINYIKNLDIAGIRRIPKADLHNHFSLGGSREYIFKATGIEIPVLENKLSSMQDMHDWNNRYIGSHFDNSEMRKLMIDATFYQAKLDGVTILEIGEDVWGLGEYFNNNISELIDAFETSHQKIAPDIELRLQIGLSRHCEISYLQKCLEPFWGHKEFYAIDLYGDEMAQPIENFIPIYQKAKENGLRLKAHIGEWGTAEDVINGIKLLNLDEVQHGIAAADSPKAIDYLVKNNIRLNIVPTSNMKLGRVENLSIHPIRSLYRAGVDVTINSDDILIFDSDVSKEYLRLYEANTLTAEELDDIRINGLRKLYTI